ncbi:unnamed protein product [Caenorhabditis angaria]|uniref:Uncharacterized protein n=1 Tax=Caenorhabditis angaria TaxID=860376 RepID=A0A9P1N1E8_9PELO|nr:unnamed protein product [Caenorhabditis angaria]
MLDEKIVVDCVTLKHFNQLEIIDLLVQFSMKQLDAGILVHFKLKRNVPFLWIQKKAANGIRNYKDDMITKSLLQNLMAEAMDKLMEAHGKKISSGCLSTN